MPSCRPCFSCLEVSRTPIAGLTSAPLPAFLNMHTHTHSHKHTHTHTHTNMRRNKHTHTRITHTLAHYQHQHVFEPDPDLGCYQACSASVIKLTSGSVSDTEDHKRNCNPVRKFVRTILALCWPPHAHCVYIRHNGPPPFLLSLHVHMMPVWLVRANASPRFPAARSSFAHRLIL